jgi:outer membrane protein
MAFNWSAIEQKETIWMNMEFKLKILIIILLLTAGAAKAQKNWTLDECIAYALENNLELESQAVTVESGKEIFEQSKRNRLPYIDAGSSYRINYGKSVDPNTNTIITNNFASNSYSLQGGIMLFEGFIRGNYTAYSRFKYHAGIEQGKALKTDIAFEVMNSFHNALYYSGLLEIVKEQKELSELNLEKIRKQSQVGISARTDILEIEARLAEEELLVIRTENNLKSSILELKRVMNFPVADELQLQEPDDIEYIAPGGFADADSIYRLALEHLPAVKARDQQLKSVEKSLAVARGNFYPSLSLYGGYYTGYYETNTDAAGRPISFRNQLKNNASQSVGLSLSIPLFNRLNTRSEVKLGKLDLEKEQVELTNYKNQLYYEIESYCQELSAMAAEFIQAQKQTESNELAFEVAQKKKEQGLFNVIDLYTSKSLLSNAQSEMLRIRLQYLLKRKTIDFYMGKPVFGQDLLTDL